MSVELKKYLESKPQSLLDTIYKGFTPQILKQLNVDNWGFVDELIGEDSKLNIAIKERENDIAGLLEMKKGINANSTDYELGKLEQ